MSNKLLIISTNLAIGGVERSLVSLLNAMSPEEFSTDLMLVDRDGALQNLVSKHIKVLDFPYKWVLMQKGRVMRSLRGAVGLNLNFFKFCFFLMKGIMTGNMGKARQQMYQSVMHTLPCIQEQYDTVIDYTGNYKAFILNKVKAKKKLSWVHGDYRVFQRDKQIDENEYKKLDAIVTVSETCREVFIEAFPDTADKCFVMPNITLKSNLLKLARQDVDFDNDFTGIRILDVTRLDPDKGLDMALDACQQLLTWGYDIKWYILGDGPERERLAKAIVNRRLTDNFVLLGSKANPYPYMLKADMIVHCSLFEGKSVAIDEAKLLAKPIILTDYATAKDQIQSEVNGLICDMSAEAVSAAAKRLIDNADLRQSFQQELQLFSIDIESSLDVFREIIG